MITLGRGELEPLPWNERLLTTAVEKTYGALPFITDANPCHMRN